MPKSFITSDRKRIVIRIDRAELKSRPEAHIAAFEKMFAPTNDGDWGGADYPEIECSGEMIGRIASAITKSE